MHTPMPLGSPPHSRGRGGGCLREPVRGGSS
jgi:hypothetical protein